MAKKKKDPSEIPEIIEDDSDSYETGSRFALNIPIYDENRSPAPGVPFERRLKKDLIWLIADITALISWLIFVAAFIMFAKAQPETDDFFSRFFDYHVYSYWDTDDLVTSNILLICAIVVSIISTIFRAFRHRRKTDSFNKSLIVVVILSAIGIAFIRTLF